MGINSAFINVLSVTPPFSEAFVTERIKGNPDTVIQDISNLMRKLTCGCATWNQYKLRIKNHSMHTLKRTNTVLYLCDSDMFTPQSKEIEARQRSMHVPLVNRVPITRLSQEELKEECILQRNSGLPDMQRLLITPGMKPWLSYFYGRTVLDEVDLPHTVEPLKTIIEDGIRYSIDPLYRPSGEPPGTYIKRSNLNTTFCLEKLPIGESDFRWLRWIQRICKGKSYLWGKHACNDKPKFVLDINDSDGLPIALINMVCFIDEKTGEIPCELLMYHGPNGKWEDYFQGDDDDDNDDNATDTHLLDMDDNDGKKKVEKKIGKGKMIDLVLLWNIIIDEIGTKLGVRHPVESFCALLCLGGTDYVRSLLHNGTVSNGAPFKFFGPNSILKIFMTNKSARDEFTREINVPCYKEMIGHPMSSKHLFFANEWNMLYLVKRFYQKKLSKFGLSPHDGEKVDSFSAIAEAERKRMNKVEMDKKKKRDRKGLASSQPVQYIELASQSGIVDDAQAIAVIRRILWNLDYFMNAGTGNYNIESALMLDRNGISRFGWQIDRNLGYVVLSTEVSNV